MRRTAALTVLETRSRMRRGKLDVGFAAVSCEADLEGEGKRVLVSGASSAKTSTVRDFNGCATMFDFCHFFF